MDMLNISPESILQLRQLWQRSETRSDLAIRLYISGFSLSGPEWSLTLDTYAPDLDECCDFDDFRVIVERDLLHAVGGLDVQYESDGEGGGFLITVRDPEVQALCGCGGGCGGCHGCDCSGGCHGCDCADCSGHCEDCEDNDF